jgi:hypothetical protein
MNWWAKGFKLADLLSLNKYGDEVAAESMKF